MRWPPEAIIDRIDLVVGLANIARNRVIINVLWSLRVFVIPKFYFYARQNDVHRFLLLCQIQYKNIYVWFFTSKIWKSIL